MEKYQIIKNTKIGINPKIWYFVNLYNSEIGDNVTISSSVEIGGAKIGDNCSFQFGAFIPPGTVIGNNVFIGPCVILTNDKFPKANNKKFKLESVIIEDNVSIGAGATILPGVKIKEGAKIGAGAVVIKDVAPFTTVIGNPGKRR